MNKIETIKNNLIDRILATRSEEFLLSLEAIFKSKNYDEVIALSSEQIEMLMMSEHDILNGDVVSEEDLNKNDFEWLK
jgi:hypothetical protein